MRGNFLKIFSSDNNLIKRVSAESCSCLMMDGGLFDYLCIYEISFSLLKNVLNVVSEKINVTPK